MLYQNKLKETMETLAKDDRTIFLGQGTVYKQHGIYYQLKDIPNEKKIELPVAEELQMGITLGLANTGLIPISIYPRFDFLMLAMNQLVNHIDKWSYLTKCKDIRAIIKVAVGSTMPLNPGVQHCQNYINELELMFYNVRLYNYIGNEIKRAQKGYLGILEKQGVHLIVEYPDYYNIEL